MNTSYSDIVSNGDDRLRWCIIDILLSRIIALGAAVHSRRSEQACWSLFTAVALLQHCGPVTSLDVAEQEEPSTAMLPLQALSCNIHAQANWRGTYKWSMGAVLASTSALSRGLCHSSLLNTTTCVVKHFRKGGQE